MLHKGQFCRWVFIPPLPGGIIHCQTAATSKHPLSSRRAQEPD